MRNDLPIIGLVDLCLVETTDCRLTLPGADQPYNGLFYYGMILFSVAVRPQLHAESSSNILSYFALLLPVTVRGGSVRVVSSVILPVEEAFELFDEKP